MTKPTLGDLTNGSIIIVFVLTDLYDCILPGMMRSLVVVSGLVVVVIDCIITFLFHLEQRTPKRKIPRPNELVWIGVIF